MELNREIETGANNTEVIIIDLPLEKSLEQRRAARNQEIRITNVQSLNDWDNSDAETVIDASDTNDERDIEIIWLE